MVILRFYFKRLKISFLAGSIMLIEPKRLGSGYKPEPAKDMMAGIETRPTCYVFVGRPLSPAASLPKVGSVRAEARNEG